MMRSMITTHRPRGTRVQQATRWLVAAAMAALAGAVPLRSDASPQSADEPPPAQPLATEPPPAQPLATEPPPAQPLATEPPPAQPAPDESTMVERDIEAEPYPGEIFDPQPGCDPYVVRQPGQRIGLGLEVGTGYQQSAEPVDPLTLALGLSAERMLRKHLVLGMRMTYLASSDEQRDEDGDGRDDQDRGNSHLVSFTAGPRLRRWNRSRGNPAAWELGLGAGFLYALSDLGVSGPVAEIELRRTWLSVVGLGLRVTQGLADAGSYRTVLASASLGAGSTPARSWGAGCSFVEPDDGPELPYAVGIHLPVLGYGGADLGAMPPGLGLSLAIPLRYPLDVMLRGDLLWFLRQGRDRLAMHTGLAGLRLAMPRTTPLAFTALAGYGVAYRPTPSNIDSGPVMDLGVSWDFARERQGGLYVGVHGRFGLAAENRDLFAIFLAAEMELRTRAYPW
jgi:hypothetical protein